MGIKTANLGKNFHRELFFIIIIYYIYFLIIGIYIDHNGFSGRGSFSF